MKTDNNQFDNVLDLDASRAIKERTGVSMPVKVSAPDTPEMVKHEKQAMSLGNPKQSLMDKATTKLGKALGIME